MDHHTASIYKQIAGTIMPGSILMEVDVPTNHSSGKVPMLDMAMWVEGNQILFCHYSKPMATKSVIMARSAFTTREIKNILLEEGSRRLRNCSPNLPWDTKGDFITALNIQMAEAGHKEEFRDMVTTRVVAKYANSLRNHHKEMEGKEGGKLMCTGPRGRGRSSGEGKEVDLPKPTGSGVLATCQFCMYQLPRGVT